MRARSALIASAAYVALMCCMLIPEQSTQHEEHIELAHKAVTKEDICANRQIPIISVKEAQRLIREIEQDPSNCPESYHQSFYELKPILVETPSEQVCSDKKFKLIQDYHFRYVNPRVETYEFGDDLNHLNTEIKRQPLTDAKIIETVQLDDFKQEIMIPISLLHFFKAWALQVSAVCKRSLVDNLERAIQNYDELDLDLIEEHAELKRAEKKVIHHPITNEPIKVDELHFDSLVYLPELEGEANKGDKEKLETVKYLDLHKQPRLNFFMHACKRRFAPVYNSLILPIVRMSKLGYDYVGKHIDDIRDKLDKDPLILKWKLITRFCESVGHFELVDEKGLDVPEMHDYEYTPRITTTIGNDIWIKSAENLRAEFAAISGYKTTGFRGFLFKAGVGGRKLVAMLDPHQSAFYRRNQNTISSTLNSLSIMSNLASIAVTVGGG